MYLMTYLPLHPRERDIKRERTKKLLLVMKFTFIFLLVAGLAASANGFSQSITLSVRNASLEVVLQEIKRQSGYEVLYNNQMLDKAQKVSITLKNAQLGPALDECFREQPLTYIITERTIVVKLKIAAVENEIPLRALIDVKGRILNENDEPVVASVQVKGTANGTTSNADGHFELRGVDENATLLVTGVSIENLELKVNGRSNVGIIVTKIKINELEAPVVKGYYTTTRKLNTGSVGRLSSKEINNQPVSNPLAALGGRISGLVITQSTGLPGANFSVLIRGRNSIQNGNEPLYLIDGVVFNSENLSQRSPVGINNPFNTINPADIESIEVMKDADATSLYGSRGANGVILITTKKGVAGKASLEFCYQTGFGNITRTMEYLSLEQYLEMRNEAFENDGVVKTNSNAGDLLLWDTTRSTDWKNLLIGNTARTNNIQLRYTGGNARFNYALSGNYYRETSVFPGNFGLTRYSFFSAINTKSENNRFSLGFTVGYTNEANDMVGQDLSSGLTLSPNSPDLYNAAGNLNWQEAGRFFSNPMAFTVREYNTNSERLTANAIAEYNILKGLSFKLNAGYNTINLSEINKTPIAAQIPDFNPTGMASFAFKQSGNWIIEPQIQYGSPSNKSSQLQILLGGSLQRSTTSGNVVSGSGYLNDVQLGSIAAAGTVVATDNYSLYKYQAIFARIGYSFKEKLLMNLTGRRDGSSRFGPGNKFANFGAIGTGWIFSKENFFAGLNKVISFGKLRASYGIVGNDQIGNYQYFDTYLNTTYRFLNQPSLRPARLFNPAYSWEQKANIDIALETGLFNNRLFLTANWFRSRSGNQIIQYTLPGQTGFNSILSNFPGLVQNKGWEFELTGRMVEKKDLTLTTSFNLTIARNSLLEFPELASSSYASTYKIGEPLDLRFLYQYNGVDPQTGIYSFEDVNQDGSINALDRQTVRSTNPLFYGGMSNSMRIGKWDISLFWQFVKQEGLHMVFSRFNAVGRATNEPAIVLDRWQKPGDRATYQRFTVSTGAAYVAANLAPNSTAAITDASFVRLKNAAIQYSPSFRNRHRLGITDCKIFLQGQNLFTFTNYQGPDPENQTVTAIPPLRMISAGIRFIF